MDPIVKIDPQIMGSAPCFAGTRVPVKLLFDWLAGGETIDYFLDQFPGVRREQAERLLDDALKSRPSPSGHVS